MKTLTIIFILAFSALLFAGKDSNYTIIQSIGSGPYTITISINGEQTTQRVSGQWGKVIKVRPGDVVTFGASANRNAVNIEIDGFGATVMPYDYEKISKTF